MMQLMIPTMRRPPAVLNFKYLCQRIWVIRLWLAAPPEPERATTDVECGKLTPLAAVSFTEK